MCWFIFRRGRLPVSFDRVPVGLTSTHRCLTCVQACTQVPRAGVITESEEDDDVFFDAVESLVRSQAPV